MSNLFIENRKYYYYSYYNKNYSRAKMNELTTLRERRGLRAIGACRGENYKKNISIMNTEYVILYVQEVLTQFIW